MKSIFRIPFDQCFIRPMFLRRKCIQRKCLRRKYLNPSVLCHLAEKIYSYISSQPYGYDLIVVYAFTQSPLNFEGSFTAKDLFEADIEIIEPQIMIQEYSLILRARRNVPTENKEVLPPTIMSFSLMKIPPQYSIETNLVHFIIESLI